MLRNWRNLPRPRRKPLEQVRPITGRTGKRKEGEKVSEGFKVAMNWGNSQGAKQTQLFRNFSGNDGRQERLTNTLGNLQDLRQRIYRKGKTEVVGGCGVDAGEKSDAKAPPTGYVP
jgi:hypothetical protein